MKEQLEAALRKLPLADGVEAKIGCAVNALASLAGGPARNSRDCAPRAFRYAASGTVRRQLDRLAKSRNPAAPISQLFQPTIIALANEGVMRADISALSREVLAEVCSKAKRKIEGRQLPSGRGQPRKYKADVVAGVVRTIYSRLTGRRDPTRIVRLKGSGTFSHSHKYGAEAGPYYELMLDVFRILGVNARPASFVRRWKKSD